MNIQRYKWYWIVTDANGNFVCSCDTEAEAEREIAEMAKEKDLKS